MKRHRAEQCVSGHINRREFLAAGSLAIVAATRTVRAASGDWDAGELVHILPAASHEHFLIKTSLRAPHIADVALRVNGRRVDGVRSDTEGKFWCFYVAGLQPATEYMLSIEHRGRQLCGYWPLKTFPHPDASPKSFRFLAFTCGGGHEAQRGPDGGEVFRPMEMRRRLLARAMSFKPEAVIANGDHIYWDQRSGYDALSAGWAKASHELYASFTPLDRALPMLGTRNETAIKQLGDPQIAQLYGVALRSVPTFFLGDDHDYFENDEANERYVTFPPDDFMARARGAVQSLYYPEMLPDATRTRAISGTRPDGISENFGTLRYGRLFEALLYDCGRWLDLKGEFGRIVPEEVEDWLVARTAANDTKHLLHVPSTPPGWSAGKWREWYPDVVVEDSSSSTAPGRVQTVHSGRGSSRLTNDRSKYMWQKGWFAQHQRLMAAATSNRSRAAMFLSGDLHAVGWAKIGRSHDIDMRANPVYSILSGPLGSSTWAWPSSARGIHPVPPDILTVLDGRQPVEKNGFTIVDVEPDAITFNLFGWREPQNAEEIDRLEPFQSLRIPRGRDIAE